MLLIGVTGDLSRADIAARDAVGNDGEALYVRLNVARAVRRHEHADLVAAHSAAVVVDLEG